jgi:hypothetical protein
MFNSIKILQKPRPHFNSNTFLSDRQLSTKIVVLDCDSS